MKEILLQITLTVTTMLKVKYINKTANFNFRSLSENIVNTLHVQTQSGENVAASVIELLFHMNWSKVVKSTK